MTEERKRKEELEKRKSRVKEVFESPWLRNTEKELKDCVEALQSSTDPDTTALVDALREVIQDKLANHHRTLGTLRCQEALNERKRVCWALELLSKEDEYLAASLTEPLPLASVIHTFGEEDEGIFHPQNAIVRSTPRRGTVLSSITVRGLKRHRSPTT